MLRRRLVRLVLLSTALAASCDGRLGTPRSLPPSTVPEAAADFTLVVSNQSFENAVMPIDVAIDGQRVVAEAFEVRQQHHFVPFHLELGPGRHRLTAAAADGTRHSATFDIAPGARRWGVLLYWFYPDERRHFTFEAMDTAPGFG